MHNHTGCTCAAFLHCAFSNVPSNGLPERMYSHIGCICLIFLHCVFSNVSSNCLHMRMHNHTGSICLSSPQFWLPSPELQYCHKIFSSHSCQDYAPSLQSRKQLRMEGLDFRIAVEEERGEDLTAVSWILIDWKWQCFKFTFGESKSVPFYHPSSEKKRRRVNKGRLRLLLFVLLH